MFSACRGGQASKDVAFTTTELHEIWLADFVRQLAELHRDA